MAIDTVTPRSRRALLMGLGGAAAAAAGATLGRALPVAADTEPVLVGGVFNNALSPTVIRNQANNQNVILGESEGDGAGVRGLSATGYGVHGEAGGAGTGVAGTSPDGTGLAAYSQHGLGLRVAEGRIRVDEVSGVATIAKNATGVTVNPGVDINAKTFVLLTPMANIGSRALWFTKNPSADTFTIRMSPARGRATKVAWLAVETG